MAKEITHLHYDSISEFRDMVAAPWRLNSNAYRAKDYTEGDHGGSSWYGVSGGSAAVLALFDKGYIKGEERITALYDKLVSKLPRAVGLGRKRVFGAEGDSLDIHKVNRGESATAWESRKRKVKQGNSTIRIVCDVGGNCSVSSDQLAWRGVAALCLAEIMQKARYKAEIVAANAADGYAGYGANGGRMLMTCVIKRAGGTADRGQLAAVLTMAGFFRTLGFAGICRAADDEGKEVTSGLGHSVGVSARLPVSDRITQIVVPHEVNNEATATKFVADSIALLQGVKRD